MPKYKRMNLFMLLQEVTIGRLVLDLPKEDLKRINEMIKQNLKVKKNAKV